MATEKKVELLQDHRHGGKTYGKGSILVMDLRIAEWLIGQGVAKSTNPNDARTATPPAMRRGCASCGGRVR